MLSSIKDNKDKPNAEGAVGIISTWILAALRKQVFFSLADLNRAIGEKLIAFNQKPFQKKPGSRQSTFLEEERYALQPLPATPYELATWKTATVQFNYHISVDKMHYSVPYEYIKHEVDVRITHSVIEVFFKSHRVCSHPRMYGRAGQYSTIQEHMPEKHKQYAEWNADRFIAWAESVGPHTSIVIKAILSFHRVEQQGYRACMGVLKLADKYSVKRLEAACARALSYTPNPSFKNIDTILKSGQDKLSPQEEIIVTEEQNTDHGFTRGAGYYGRSK